ncbi:MAG: AraC family transcriptional regulator [Alcanivorax sp.]|nr:AraC family transcriptional regulator [Alcanivorax sp.]
MNPDLAITYCRMITQTLGLDYAGLETLVQGTGIDVETLLHSDGFIDWPGICQLIANVHQITDQPDIALQTGLRALPAMHGPMGVAAMASPTLRDAMHLFARYNNTRTRIFNTVMEETPTHITLRLKFAYPKDSVIQFLTESAMASSYACHVVLRGKPIDGGTVYFNYPPPPWADCYPQVFRGTRIVFDAPDVALSLPASYGDEPLLSHDRDLLWVAIQQCEVRQEALRKQGTISDRVLSLLQQKPGKASLDGIADQLHMSPRTLIRKLKQEDTRFQQLLDQTLSRRAAQLLSLPHYTVAAVAEDLGYTDVASFRRAFQRWFGTSPGRFREE